jgi:hypothetical protein
LVCKVNNHDIISFAQIIRQTAAFAVTNKRKVTFWPIISQFPLVVRFASFDRIVEVKRKSVDFTISLIDYCQNKILEFTACVKILFTY